MKHFVLTECYGSLPISDQNSSAFTTAQADELSSYISLNRLEQHLVQISRKSVTFTNYVGFIQLSSCSIEILPKVSSNEPAQSRRVLLRMLERTGFLEVNESQAGQINYEKMNLFEILALLFTEKILRELSKGILRTYITLQEELNTVRGRVDTISQIRRNHLKSTAVSCIFDEFHPNHDLNKVFKLTLRKIMAQSNILKTRKRANHAMMYLDEVADTVDERAIRTPIHFDRSNQRYQESYRLAMLLLSQSAPTSQRGKNIGSSILFKMNELFESYIAHLIRKLTPNVIIRDHSHKLLINSSTERGVFQLEPDLLITGTNGQSIIIDTKWKRIDSSYNRHGVKREDFYQMYAYLTRYERVGTVILLYPHHDGISRTGDAPLESWYIEGLSDKRLLVYSINYEDEGVAKLKLQSLIEDYME
ncbi:McrC family protein [Paenibacillus sp. VMFN-D1]|uniref:McrC family protein n=1 Tax=Paenibacillus sp. VMFN-D1 TaxID=2135608 RepID=UPI000E22A328|nr:McrC family protein [Paenibacillus sp. VMFN-D1]RED32185.1 5-methylcytosine-specific restriction enzyme subunit McrC [Paenibacillus sp. VMFN-D1]